MHWLDSFFVRGYEIKPLLLFFFFQIVGFLFPLLANLVCSSLVLRTLRRPVTVGRGCDSKKRVLRMIVVHLTIFIICFVPYNLLLFLYALVRTQALANCTVERFARTLYPITLCLASLNCCLDPVVYYFTSESFQKSLTISGKGSGSRPESIPRSDTETQYTIQNLSTDTQTVASNGKETTISDSQLWLNLVGKKWVLKEPLNLNNEATGCLIVDMTNK